MNRVDNVKKVIDFFYFDANCGIFNSKGIANDTMTTVYDMDGVRVDICYDWDYFEVFGLTETEFGEVEEYYNSLENSYEGAPGKEISASKSDATNSMAGPHKVENWITKEEAAPSLEPVGLTNFDVELQKVKVEELAYLRSHWTHCEDCPLVDECVKDELTCLDLWVRYLKEAAK